MKLLLHIGTGKTGSTTIQNALTVNQEKLRASGIHYSVANGTGNHVFLPLLVADKGNFSGMIRRLGLADPEKRAQAREKWMRELTNEVDGLRGRVNLFILTAEHLCSLNDDEVGRLEQQVLRIFDEVEVVVYLRDPVDYAVSMYDTALKLGSTRAGPRLPADYPELDYMALLKRWEGAVGKSSLRVRLFERDALANGDVVEDFFDCIGLEIKDLVYPERRNESMDLLGQALMLRLNRMVPHIRKDGSLNQGRAHLSRLVALRFTNGGKLKASSKLAATYERAFAAGNEWVRKTYFPDRQRLFSEKQRDATEALDIADVYLDEMAQAIHGLWRDGRQRQAKAWQESKNPDRAGVEAKDVYKPGKTH